MLASDNCYLYLNLTLHLASATFSDADHRRYIAEHWVAMLEETIRRVDAFRAAYPEHPIVDVRYDDLVAEPVATVESIYSAFSDSMTLDTRGRDAMAAYAAAHPKDALGVHEYDLSEFGLDAAQLAERFSGYVRRYDVPARRAP